MSARREIRCLTCNTDKAYPDGFPGPFAECWSCSWQKHLKEGHKRWWRRKIIKPAKAAARARYLREETDRRIAEAPTELMAKGARPIADEP